MSAFGNMMLGGAANAIGQFGSSFGQGLSDAIFGGINAQREWKYKQKEMALQQQYALEQMAKSAEFQLTHDKTMFDYQNAYNDPTKVFERYAKAGITPAGVLGSSGVGVNATVPTSSGGAPSGGHVSSSGFDVRSGVGGSNMASTLMVDAQKDLLLSSAQKNEAEADYLKGQTHTEDYRKRMDDFEMQAKEYGVDTAKYYRDLIKWQGTIAEENAWLLTVSAGYRLEEYQARVANMTEEAAYWRTKNDFAYRQFSAELAVMDSVVMLNEVNAALGQKRTELTEQQLIDFRNYVSKKWDDPVDVPIYNEKGDVVDHKRMTYGEMAMWLDVNRSELLQMQKGAVRWDLRSEKNRLGYSILTSFTSELFETAGDIATSYASKGFDKAFSPNRTIGSERVFDAEGNLIKTISRSSTNLYD